MANLKKATEALQMQKEITDLQLKIETTPEISFPLSNLQEVYDTMHILNQNNLTTLYCSRRPHHSGSTTETLQIDYKSDQINEYIIIDTMWMWQNQCSSAAKLAAELIRCQKLAETTETNIQNQMLQLSNDMTKT